MHEDGEIVERLPLPAVKELEGILSLRAGIAREVLASALLPEAAAVLPSAASALVAAFLAAGHPSVSGVMERRADGGLRIHLQGQGGSDGASPPQVTLPPLLPGGVQVGPADGGAAWCIEARGGVGAGQATSPATLYETEAAWLRMAAGTASLDVVPLAPLLEELQAAFSGRAQATGVSVRVALPEEALRVRTDRDRLFGLLSELAGNAFRFSRAGAEIVISARKAPGVVYVAVQDTGPGMSPEILETLFRWDWQPGRPPPEGSRGPGFALSRRTAEAMGGTLDAESQVGVGTTVRVGLPLA
jgi:anti-sigma regulatory factor (Ser/Thr protein kinase)